MRVVLVALRDRIGSYCRNTRASIGPGGRELDTLGQLLPFWWIMVECVPQSPSA
jgi:hypothetical protein